MAQFQKNFYGTSYYGETNAFTGIYETSEIPTDEPLTGKFTARINGKLPYSRYGYKSVEIERTSGAWSETDGYLASKSPSAELLTKITCDKLRIHYRGTITAPSIVNVKVTTREPGKAPVVKDYTFDPTQKYGDTYYEVDGLTYAPQEVRIFLAADNTNQFSFHSVEARTTNVVVETRAKLTNGTWSSYQKSNTTIAEQQDGTCAIEGLSASYKGSQFVQLRLHLASSDNEATPLIDSIDTFSGDTDNRTEDGSWAAMIDMNLVAAEKQVGFSRIVGFDWEGSAPDKTSLTIRSRGSKDSSAWTAWTVPYRKGTKRLRLRDGKTFGHIITPLIDPSSTNSHIRINQWESWSDISFLPPDETSTKITYTFIDEKGDTIYRVENPQKLVDRSLLSIGSKPFRLVIKLDARFDKSSPAVDMINLKSNLIYEQEHHVTDRTISTVDNQNTGKKMVFSIDELTFDPPPEALNPIYYLEDKTILPEGIIPEDVSLYYDKEKDLSTRSNMTTNGAESVWVESKARNANGEGGLLSHYQYGGGLSYYTQNDEVGIASSFTPALSNAKEYRFFAKSGWPTRYHQVQAGETLVSVALLYGNTTTEIEEVNPNLQYNQDNTLVTGQTIEMPNDTLNKDVEVYWKSEEELEERTNVTSISAHNAKVLGLPNEASDYIVGEVVEVTAKGLVEWVSDEKIYFGGLNTNDQKEYYIREHRTPESGDSLDILYIVGQGDTCASIAEQFGVDEQDVRLINQLGYNEEPMVESEILVPSRIVLPKIDPRVQIGKDPYAIEIVYNSVKQGDRTISDSLIDEVELEIIEEEVEITREEVRRGEVPNTYDILNNPKVTKVTGIWDSLNDPIAAPSYIQGIHYKVVGNFIDWSLTPGGVYSEPTPTSNYYVSYTCMKPVGVRIKIGSTYQELGGTDEIWRSPEVKEFSGHVFPGLDYRRELPPISEWQDANNPAVTDIQYIIEDNDLWVKSWIEEKDGKMFAVGSLKGLVPKDNWLPYIHTGYYYIGKDEYYLFSEEREEGFSQADIPIAKNVSYTKGKYLNAIKLEQASKNIVKNSGFEKSSSQASVLKITF